MSKFIDADAVLSLVDDITADPGYRDAWQATIRRGITDLPEAIVRCENCENWVPGYVTDNDDFIPPKCGKYQQMVGHSSNDYCSLAKRRTDG